MAKTVTILLHDQLQAVGLKTLLHDCFGAQVTVLASDNMGEIDHNADLYVTQPELLVANLNYFLPRKEKILMVGEGESIPNWPMSLSPRQDVDSIIATLDEILNSQNDGGGSTLSQREVDVLKLVAQGLINKEIANQLNISINTVLTHRKNITAKLGIKSVSGLCVYALMNGIIEA